MMKTICSTLFLIPILFYAQADAQIKIDLFDSNRGVKKTKQVKPVKAKKPGGRINVSSKFLGASQLGKATKFFFRDNKNQSVVVDWNKESKTSLPGASDYIIEDYKERVLYVRYPKNKQCMDNKNNGVACVDGDQLLTMNFVRVVTRPNPPRAAVKPQKPVRLNRNPLQKPKQPRK